jgi:hypothetical protein
MKLMGLLNEKDRLSKQSQDKDNLINNLSKEKQKADQEAEKLRQSQRGGVYKEIFFILI